MELVVILAAEGLLLYTTRRIVLDEFEVIRKWKSGTLSYDQILALKQYKPYLLKKLDRRIRIGKNPGLFKKED